MAWLPINRQILKCGFQIIIGIIVKYPVNNVDIVGYLERCERIRKDNPDMSAELSREIFGGASEIFMTE